MKKLALLLTISVSAQEKKNFASALAHAGLTKQETVKALFNNLTQQIKIIDL